MKFLTEYQKPELQEYSHFGIVAEGISPGGPGKEREDTDVCNVSTVDEF